MPSSQNLTSCPAFSLRTCVTGSATALLLTALGLFLAGTPTYAQGTSPAPTPPPAPSAEALGSPFGITSSASSFRTDSEWFPKMSAAGIYWARMFPEWSSLEPAAGQWHFDETDALLQSAASNHIEISGLFFGSPSWVDPRIHAFPMFHLNDWSDYASKLVARYKDRVHYWEVWNEGNAAFNDGKNNTSDYASLVAAAYEGAKKSDPNARVGMSVASFDAPYLDQAILAQAKMGKPGHFDYLCFHPYEVTGDFSDPNGEIPYLWMTHLTREMLKADAPDRANAEIWLTEVGRPLGDKKENKESDSVDQATAANTLVKCYTMAIAQGVQRICWFEAQDPVGEPPGYGLLGQDGAPRASYTAMKTMTDQLGAAPKNIGWLTLGAKSHGYGFVFQGKSAPVMAAWMPIGETDKSITFSGDVNVVDPQTGTMTSLKAGEPFSLTDAPVFVASLPSDFVAKAKGNAGKNFSWGGDYTAAQTVSLQLGPQPVTKGVFPLNLKDMPAYTFPDGSTGVQLSGNINQPATFYIHPSFAGFKTRDYYVRLTLRRIGPGNVGMNFNYEVADSGGQDGPMRNNGGWYSASPDSGWQTHVWHLTDACFSKMWGYDLSFNPEQSVPFVIGKVEVSTQPLN